ncbi:penicillin-binding protein activator [Methylobacterium trifolii]|uniref:Penicillin-binding protein activator LpoA n=1 Tax=Methylobacterium trifolii TaxID=1003092 RepID=A0ABQ4U4V6_9HYPH|nr:penicillin-binding protein activator [Methylobacterium trifolii]GJE62073.1 Penicillin-binding protein activator LpoA [Methylobacterium trifolii]
MAPLTRSRARIARAGAAAAMLGPLLVALGACVGGPDAPRAVRNAPPPQADLAPPVDPAPGGPVSAGSAGTKIGNGPVKLALVLPLTGQGAVLGAAMRNAAELAYDESQAPDLQILVKDDRGAPDGAREAAQAAVSEGADILLGPLFAANVQAAAVPARNAGKPVVAFSTDATVAARGIYLLSFLPQAEVDRVVEEAVAGGRRSFAALIPETAYGNAVEAQFREAVSRKGARLAGIERYPAGAPGPAIERLAGVITGPAAQADTLFIPETADGLAVVAGALTKAGFSPARVRPVGTALWNEPRLFALPALQGGRFAAPDPAGFSAFASRYQARFGASPPRVAALAYDAVSLSVALNRQYGSQRFAEGTLTKAGGFAGIDGTFRFRADGLTDRSLAVYEIRNNGATIVGPAPRALAKSGT